MDSKAYYVYILMCKDKTLYTGVAADPAHRLRQHLERSPACAKYTRSRGVEALQGLWRAADKSSAMRMEYAIKRLRKEKKEALLDGRERWREFLPELSELEIEAMPDMTMEACLEREWKDGN